MINRNVKQMLFRERAKGEGERVLNMVKVFYAHT
jgi:hypothetical protein